MSSHALTQRRSWRQKKQTGGNRWAGRLLMTCIVLLLLGWFIYLLWPEPNRELRSFLVHARSFDTDVIMPPMYGETASKQIESVLASMGSPLEKEIWGTEKTIANDIESAFESALAAKHAMTMVIVRGYLLKDADGQASIACSDLDVRADSTAPVGLLPLSRILEPLSTQGPSGFSGGRLVVLDLEPLGVIPRLNQFGDETFELLEEQVAGLTTPLADRLWVLVTRGPMQNAGWDPQAHLPVSTQTLLDGLAGKADANEDYRIELNELTSYIAQRYKQFSVSQPPEIIVLQGGVGRIAESSEVANLWVSRAEPAEQEPEEEAAEPSDEASETAEPDQPKENTASRSRRGNAEATTAPSASIAHAKLESRRGPSLTAARFNQAGVAAVVSPLVMRGLQAEAANSGSAQQDQPADDQDQPADDVADPATKAEEVAGQESSDQPASAESAAESNDKDQAENQPPQPSSFWDLRDAFEAAGQDSSLHPIAVAPHVWRHLVLKVLHAEIRSMDPNCPNTRAQIPQDEMLDLQQLQQAIKQGRAPPRWNGDECKGLYTLWTEANQLPIRQRLDPQVRVADELQFAISVARTRWWSQRLYQQQAIAVGGDPLPFSTTWRNDLNSAEELLVGQSGSSVDQQRMSAQTNRIRGLIEKSASLVSDQITKLLSDFSRADAANESVWNEIRRAYAWLRSPLPTGEQRRQLIAAIQQHVIPAASSEFALETLPLGKTNPTANQIETIGQIRSLAEQQLAAKNLSGLDQVRLALSNDDFAKSFPSALRIDPRDVDMEAQRKPILNQVAAVPHEPNPKWWLADASGSAGSVVQDLNLQSRDPMSVWVKVQPDSLQTSRVYISFADGSAESPVSLDWELGSGLEKTGDSKKVILQIPPGKVGMAKLTVLANQYADDRVTRFPIEIRVEPEDPVNLQLRRRETIQIGLPKQDQIRVAVETEGLTRQWRNGDSFAEGVWMRTFASSPEVGRETRFFLSLFNESGRQCRAKVWLLKLSHPFPREKVLEYWPDLLVGRWENWRTRMLDRNGQVLQRLLESEDVVKGPATISIGAGREPTTLDWKAPEGDAGSAPPAADDAASGSPSGTDVTHGMALVVRLVDDKDKPLPGGDQLLWLIPKPWTPNQYIDVERRIRYSRGKVQVSATLKPEIDGDNEPDVIPDIVRKPITLRWKEDDQWGGFVAGKSRPLDEQTAEVTDVRDGHFVPVRVSDFGDTSVRLDVDGWPRAIRYTVSNTEDSVGEEKTKWDEIKFSSVAIDYGENPPQEPDDAPLGDAAFYYPDDSVVFRGGGKKVNLKLAADFSSGAYQRNEPPEIQILLDDNLVRKYWSDRSIRTTVTEVKDNGRITLVTSVSDLELSAAAPRNDVLQFRAKLQALEESSQSLSINLDSEPPAVISLAPKRNGPYFVGEKIEWTVTYQDQGLAPTEVTQLLLAVDDDGDGKPTGKPIKLARNQKNRFGKIFELEKTEDDKFRIAAQVWDQAGNASRPLSRTITVKERPKPKPKPDPKMAQSPKADSAGKAAAPPPPPKRGAIRGKIDTRSTLRGTLQLSPAPSKMRPAGGKVNVGGPNPRFDFSNVPAGEYTLIFEGTLNGSTKSLTWSGLKIDSAGGKPSWALPLSDAE